MVPAVTAAGPVFVMERLATAATVVAVVDALFWGLESAVVLPTDAVLLIVDPSGALELTCSTIRNVSLAPAATVAAVSVMVPVPPDGGVVKT